MLQEIERNGKREHRHDSDTLFDAMALEDTKYAVLKTPCAILERDLFSLHALPLVVQGASLLLQSGALFVRGVLTKVFGETF